MTFPLLRQDAAVLQLLQRPRGCIGQACFSPHSSRSTERQRTASFCDASAMQALRKHCAYPLSEPKRSVRVAASAAAAGGDQDSGVQTSSLVNTLILGGLFAGWYAANIYFNIYNKQVLKVFPFPMTCTTIQFAVGSLITAACWAAGIVKLPKVTPAVLKRVAPLAFAHTLGNLLTNMSLGLVAVSFTHTIKASEPLFSVALSMLVLGDRPHPLVLATLVPIIGGVGIASLSEASFNWGGFLTAMGSNLTFQSRNVLSKKLMGAKGPDTIDKTNLFGMMTIMAFFMLLPIAIAVEGWQLAPAALDALGITNHQELLSRALATGLTFHLYQQVSYLILERVSPVTHSIGNCVKRVVVIVASVIFFQNPMSTQNMLGTAIALAGVFAYSQVKRLASPKGKPAAAASE